MNKSIAAILMAATVSGPGASVPGGPLQKSWIDADAKWLGHVDVEALTGSTIGGLLLEQAEHLDVDLDDLDDFQNEIGMDPRTDVMSVTFYGATGDLESDGVLIAVTNARAEEALERLTHHDGIESRTIERDGYEVHVLTDGGDSFYLHLRAADRPDRRVAVLGSDEDVVLDALRVIDGRAASLPEGKSPILDGGPAKGSIVFIAAADVCELPEIEAASGILRLSDGVTVDIGETDGVLRADATVSAASAEVASDIAQVIKGLVALGHLAVDREPDLAPLTRFARALDVTTHDTKITVRFRYESQKLVDELETIVD
ncbi:MAG: hypothetical protein ACYS0G_10250 [Planctomycetota bacterium]|jgi:hypothetical protein